MNIILQGFVNDCNNIGLENGLALRKCQAII